MTESKKRKIYQAIAECDRFIELEESKSDDLRPSGMAELLQSYKEHREKLTNMLRAW